ncbi:MAG TPA: hypothetical protein VKT19_06270 [Steroidobacteraceae bacterium]|nr:hypothetical protein [Steroidobacteraceae bacterium]
MGHRAGSARSARARGLRTLQHQALPRSTLRAIEAEVWLRTLVVEAAQHEGADGALVDPGWATKDQVYDEALAWFLQRPTGARSAAKPPVGRAATRRGAAGAAGTAGTAGTTSAAGADRTPRDRRSTHQDVTFWVDSRLLSRVRRAAASQGLRTAQLVEHALAGFSAELISPAIQQFHRRTQRRALALHRQRSRVPAEGQMP